MDDIKDMYYSCESPEHTFMGYSVKIINGFKLTRYDDGKYTILDTRHSDFYTTVTKLDFAVIKACGVNDGSRLISHERNNKRVLKYIMILEELFQKKKVADSKIKNGGKKPKRFYEKQVKNIKANIHEQNYLLQNYKTKVEQFNKFKSKSNE
jgi:hypothetical protein